MKKLSNPNREQFCQLYASNKEFFGNGVASYVLAYNINLDKRGAYASARTGAYRLLTNDDILKRIDELLDIYINDQVVDKELAFVIIQKAELSSKVSAIKEYNQVKGRIKQRMEHTGDIIIKHSIPDNKDAK